MYNTQVSDLLGESPQVSVMELKKSLDEKKRFVLIDVRTKEEYGRGKIDRSMNIPVDEIYETIQGIIPDKKRLVYVYCLSGSRSAIAVNIMRKLGYTNVFDVKSGLLAWRTKQYPVQP